MMQDLLFAGALFLVLYTVIVVSIIRWVFRIDVIVSELKAIRKALGREGEIAHSKPIAFSEPKSSWTSFWDAFLYRE